MSQRGDSPEGGRQRGSADLWDLSEGIPLTASPTGSLAQSPYSWGCRCPLHPHPALPWLLPPSQNLLLGSLMPEQLQAEDSQPSAPAALQDPAQSLLRAGSLAGFGSRGLTDLCLSVTPARLPAPGACAGSPEGLWECFFLQGAVWVTEPTSRSVFELGTEARLAADL